MNKNANDRHREGYKHWDMTTFGWKYNMDNIQAAMLLPQMARLEENWRKRRELAEYYESRLWDIPNLSRPKTLPTVDHAQHLFTIWIGEGKRDHWHDRSVGIEGQTQKAVGKWMPEELMKLAEQNVKK